MTTTYKICLLAGDGIGPEIIAEGVKVLNAVGAKYDAAFEYTDALIGGAAIDATGEPLSASHAGCGPRVGCGAAGGRGRS